MPIALGPAPIGTFRLGAALADRIYAGGTLLWQKPTATAVDPGNLWRAPQQVDNYLAANPQLQPLADQPQGRWIGEWTTPTDVQSYVSAAAGKTMLLVVYAIPNRDAGSYSAGGFPDRASYLAWLTGIRDAIGSAPAILVYEPDALGHANGFDATTKAERIETLRQGVGVLAAAPNAETYVDASRWIPTATQADLLRQVDVAKIAGFSQNVSGYDAQADLYTYGDAVLTQLATLGISGKRYVNDTSRNGTGPLTDADRPLADPWLNTSQGWCNPPKRRTGLTPRVSTHTGCRAELWIKNPGESDGTFPTTTASTYFGENAPSAGTFWLPLARDLLGLHTPPAAATGTISDVEASFDDGTYGSFTPQGSGISIVSGRARVPCGVNTYANLITAASYTAKGGAVRARLYPAAAGGATTAGMVTTDLLVNAPTAGTRLVARVDTAKGVTYLGAESGYYDPAGVNLTYDAAAHAWVRIRESGGSVYWDTSPDGTTWTTRKTAATPSWITTTKDTAVQLITNRDTGTANYAEFDSVNT